MAFLIILLIFSYVQTQDLCRQANVQSVNDNTTVLRLSNEKFPEGTTYKWSISFQRNRVCKNIQRCNLMSKQSAESLGKYLLHYVVDNNNPIVLVNNTLILPDVDYNIGLMVLHNGQSISTKTFKLPMNKSDDMVVVNKNIGAVNLLGSNITFADLEYFLVANLTLCSLQIENVTLHWKLLDKTGKSIKNIIHNGTDLRLEANMFSAGTVYIIQSDLTGPDNTLMDSKNKSVNILNRAASLKLNTNALTTGSGQPIRIIALTGGADNTKEDLNIEWSCKFDGSDGCEGFQANSSILMLENGFKTSGKYNITAKILQNEQSIEDSCVVTIKSDISQSIEISNIANIVVNPWDGVEITGRITKLIAECLLEWNSLDGAGYTQLDLSSMPGYRGIHNVTIKEDTILEELTDFNNETVDKEFTLAIPAMNDTWGGLKGDALYSFRLTVDCPVEGSKETSHMEADVLIKTNSGPKAKPVMVSPSTGVALLTKFTFKSERAEDKTDDYPLSYQFGYTIENRTVYFVALGDFFTFDSILPYSDTGQLLTKLRVCDNKGSCTDIKGPNVEVTFPGNLTEKDDDNLKRTFVTSLTRRDYNKAFTHAMAVLLTFKGFKNDLLITDMEDFVTATISAEYKTLIGSNSDEDLKMYAQDLIKYTMQLAGFIKLPEGLLKDIITLREKLTGHKIEKIVTVEEYQKSLFTNVTTMKTIHQYLEITEFVIEQSINEQTISEQKSQLIRTLSEYLGHMCVHLYRGTSIKFDLPSIKLTMEKFTTHNFNGYTIVPIKGNTWENRYIQIKLNEVLKPSVNNNKLCMAKGVFKGYLNQNGFVYLADIFDATTGNYFQPNSIQQSHIVKMKAEIPNQQGCAVYYKSNWETCNVLEEKGGYIKCNCQNTGYYSYGKRLVIATEKPETTLQTTQKPPTTLIDILTGSVTTKTPLNEVQTTLKESETITTITTITPRIVDPDVDLTSGGNKVTTVPNLSDTTPNTTSTANTNNSGVSSEDGSGTENAGFTTEQTIIQPATTVTTASDVNKYTKIDVSTNVTPVPTTTIRDTTVEGRIDIATTTLQTIEVTTQPTNVSISASTVEDRIDIVTTTLQTRIIEVTTQPTNVSISASTEGVTTNISETQVPDVVSKATISTSTVGGAIDLTTKKSETQIPEVPTTPSLEVATSTLIIESTTEGQINVATKNQIPEVTTMPLPKVTTSATISAFTPEVTTNVTTNMSETQIPEVTTMPLPKVTTSATISAFTPEATSNVTTKMSETQIPEVTTISSLEVTTSTTINESTIEGRIDVTTKIFETQIPEVVTMPSREVTAKSTSATITAPEGGINVTTKMSETQTPAVTTIPSLEVTTSANESAAEGRIDITTKIFEPQIPEVVTMPSREVTAKSTSATITAPEGGINVTTKMSETQTPAITTIPSLEVTTSANESAAEGRIDITIPEVVTMPSPVATALSTSPTITASTPEGRINVTTKKSETQIPEVTTMPSLDVATSATINTSTSEGTIKVTTKMSESQIPEVTTQHTSVSFNASTESHINFNTKISEVATMPLMGASTEEGRINVTTQMSERPMPKLATMPLSVTVGTINATTKMPETQIPEVATNPTISTAAITTNITKDFQQSTTTTISDREVVTTNITKNSQQSTTTTISDREVVTTNISKNSQQRTTTTISDIELATEDSTKNNSQPKETTITNNGSVYSNNSSKIPNSAVNVTTAIVTSVIEDVNNMTTVKPIFTTDANIVESNSIGSKVVTTSTRPDLIENKLSNNITSDSSGNHTNVLYTTLKSRDQTTPILTQNSTTSISNVDNINVTSNPMKDDAQPVGITLDTLTTANINNLPNSGVTNSIGNDDAQPVGTTLDTLTTANINNLPNLGVTNSIGNVTSTSNTNSITTQNSNIGTPKTNTSVIINQPNTTRNPTIVIVTTLPNLIPTNSQRENDDDIEVTTPNTNVVTSLPVNTTNNPTLIVETTRSNLILTKPQRESNGDIEVTTNTSNITDATTSGVTSNPNVENSISDPNSENIDITTNGPNLDTSVSNGNLVVASTTNPNMLVTENKPTLSVGDSKTDINKATTPKRITINENTTNSIVVVTIGHTLPLGDIKTDDINKVTTDSPTVSNSINENTTNSNVGVTIGQNKSTLSVGDSKTDEIHDINKVTTNSPTVSNSINENTTNSNIQVTIGQNKPTFSVGDSKTDDINDINKITTNSPTSNSNNGNTTNSNVVITNDTNNTDLSAGDSKTDKSNDIKKVTNDSPTTSNENNTNSNNVVTIENQYKPTLSVRDINSELTTNNPTSNINTTTRENIASGTPIPNLINNGISDISSTTTSNLGRTTNNQNKPTTSPNSNQNNINGPSKMSDEFEITTVQSDTTMSIHNSNDIRNKPTSLPANNGLNPGNINQVTTDNGASQTLNNDGTTFTSVMPDDIVTSIVNKTNINNVETTSDDRPMLITNNPADTNNIAGKTTTTIDTQNKSTLAPDGLVTTNDDIAASTIHNQNTLTSVTSKPNNDVDTNNSNQNKPTISPESIITTNYVVRTSGYQNDDSSVTDKSNNINNGVDKTATTNDNQNKATTSSDDSTGTNAVVAPIDNENTLNSATNKSNNINKDTTRTTDNPASDDVKHSSDNIGKTTTENGRLHVTSPPSDTNLVTNYIPSNLNAATKPDYTKIPETTISSDNMLTRNYADVTTNKSNSGNIGPSNGEPSRPTRASGQTSNVSTVTPSTGNSTGSNTTERSASIKTGSFLGSSMTKGDTISLVVIGLSIVGMIIVGVVGTIYSRIKRERTIETSDALEFPKYANVYHQDTLQSVPS